MSQEPSLCELTSKMRRATWIPRPGPTLSASVRSRNAHVHVTRAILRENYQGNAAPDGSTHALWIVRACAIEMHMDMSQQPFCARIMRWHAADQLDPKTVTRSVCEPAQSQHTWTCQKSQFYAEIFNEKRRKTNWTLWSSTGLDSYHKNPSMWTRFLGKNRCKRN